MVLQEKYALYLLTESLLRKGEVGWDSSLSLAWEIDSLADISSESGAQHNFAAHSDTDESVTEPSLEVGSSDGKNFECLTVCLPGSLSYLHSCS